MSYDQLWRYSRVIRARNAQFMSRESVHAYFHLKRYFNCNLSKIPRTPFHKIVQMDSAAVRCVQCLKFEVKLICSRQFRSNFITPTSTVPVKNRRFHFTSNIFDGPITKKLIYRLPRYFGTEKSSNFHEMKKKYTSKRQRRNIFCAIYIGWSFFCSDMYTNQIKIQKKWKACTGCLICTKYR